ncbi:unnamed protein product [Cercospora beticola]|nr:unnamed protein product [Cercospora beticola]
MAKRKHSSEESSRPSKKTRNSLGGEQREEEVEDNLLVKKARNPKTRKSTAQPEADRKESKEADRPLKKSRPTASEEVELKENPNAEDGRPLEESRLSSSEEEELEDDSNAGNGRPLEDSRPTASEEEELEENSHAGDDLHTDGVEPEALSEADRQRQAEERRKAQGRLDTRWSGSWTLGAGVYGAAELWLKQDTDGNICDRLVIKNTVPSYTTWTDRSLWTRGSRGYEIGSIPTEVQAMYRLRGKIGSENIVKIRNWRINRTALTYRIMMEYCPYSDLWDLCMTGPYMTIGAWGRRALPTIDLTAPESEALTNAIVAGEAAHERAGFAARFKQLRSARPPIVPEPFVWSLLETLATAGVLMERGELESKGIVPWFQIIHRDLKPGNLFVSPPSKERYRGYPQVKVGDFGAALFMVPSDLRNAADIDIYGTPGYMAPEQMKYQSNDGDELVNMSSATDVYAVGAVLWEVLTGLPLPVPKDAETGKSLEVEPLNPEWVRKMTFEPPALDATSKSFYSQELRDLIYAMLRHNAAARPSFGRILKKCLKFANSPENPARGLRDAPANDARYQGKFRLVLPNVYSDVYTIGMSIDQVDLEGYTGPKDEWPPSLPVSEAGDSDASDDLGGDPGAELEDNPGAQLEDDSGAQLEDNDDDDDDDDGDSRRDEDSDGGLLY